MFHAPMNTKTSLTFSILFVAASVVLLLFARSPLLENQQAFAANTGTVGHLYEGGIPGYPYFGGYPNYGGFPYITGYGHPYDTGGDHSYNYGYGYPYHGDHSYDYGYRAFYHHHHHHHHHHTD